MTLQGREEMGKGAGKPTTLEMALTEHLKELAKGFLEIEKQPVEVQKEIYRNVMSEYKKMSAEDKKAFRTVLNTVIQELFPEEVS